MKILQTTSTTEAPNGHDDHRHDNNHNDHRVVDDYCRPDRSACRRTRPPEQRQKRPEHRRCLTRFSVEAELSRVGYDRDLFDHWSDLDGDRCNTRYEVLVAESLEPAETSDGCRPTSGLWLSAFDGTTTTNPRSFDIDHLVPLAEAWDSGANSWSSSRREAFANDETSPLTLIAVSASSNRSKGDRDPAEWLPPAVGYRCEYVAGWVAVKARWELSIDPAEKTAIESVRCLMQRYSQPQRQHLPPPRLQLHHARPLHLRPLRPLRHHRRPFRLRIPATL